MIVTISSKDQNINWDAQGQERIIENARNIIRTKRYEVPFMRDMGLNPDFIDCSANELIENISSDVVETLEIYESRVTVLDVTVEDLDENGNYTIVLDLEV